MNGSVHGPNPISKILVANRGEIAVRVFRACRAHGIKSVAVYSDADRNAYHVSQADQAVCIGPSAASESYLVVAKIVEAAKQVGADAIHPGYGFLSERAQLAEACDAAGLRLIGPPSEAMKVMGDKLRARAAVEVAGVPLVPGRSELTSVAEAKEGAQCIGFPIMLKAAAGGGGRGMRVVENEQDLENSFRSASREAFAAFGDGRVFMERFVTSARHVEVQILADTYGNVEALFERDCSVQRRHQKVIEEAPCPSVSMTEEVRKRILDVAVSVAKSVDYVGAGTVEFLFEEMGANDPRFYFLEMNTRLQVEHPVTEEITGRDLVWDQIRVAEGMTLAELSGPLERRGHAIECRIYAEDPVFFRPSPGTITKLHWPSGPGIRVDAGVEEGNEVSSFYDPMIAKFVAWGPDRRTAIARMIAALDDTAVLGIETNLAFHRKVLRESDFARGEISTDYIDEHPDVTAVEQLPPEIGEAIAAAVALEACAERGQPDGAGERVNGTSSWQAAVRWRR